MAVGDGLSFLLDAALVEDFQNGDRAAFDQLMRAHLPWVFALCRRIGGRDAEDLCQEVFLEAYQSLPSLRQPRTFSSWLRSLAWRRCQRQMAKARPSEPLDPDGVHNSANPWDAFVAEFDIGPAIGQLPAMQRQVAVMSFVYGYDEKTMSSFLGIAQGTVKSRLHGARRRLQILLSQDEGGMTVDLRERIIQDVRDRIKQFDAHIEQPSEADIEAQNRNVQAWHDRRQADAVRNAALYGTVPKEVGPRMTAERMMSNTLSFFCSRDYWGVPDSVVMLDGRDTCRRLLISPFTLLKWVRQGMPCITYYPWRKYDLSLTERWLADSGIEAPREVTRDDVDDLTRYVLTEVHAGRASVDDGLEVLDNAF